jgi:hypothetical protein
MDVKKLHKSILDALETGKKAEFALDILYSKQEPKSLLVPEYIGQGLKWLERKLLQRQEEVLITAGEKTESKEIVK